jgi:serine/threonine protein kinase
MATGISSRSFISALKRSGVVSEEELNRALAAIQERGELSLDNPQSLAKAMIEDGVITRWQAEKLLQGKHKGFFLGPYRLLDMLGKGGMGAVYLAEHTLMRRRCAIKVLPTKNIGSRSYLERFYREAQAVAAMDHKNIVRAYDVNQAKVGEADVHFLAMEFVEGRDLQRLVDEDGVLPFSQAAEYIRQSAEGLAHAHEANMVHRDIKPANLLVNSKGVVKILDLGLAKFYDDQQEVASLTVAHNETVLGTADYLAPEQAVDSHNTDHRADIYSLGCTFYFLLAGHPPFCEGSVANRLLHHQMKPPPPIRDDRPDCPESLLVIIDRMMAKKREERYQSAKDVSDDLAEWLVENGNDEWRERNPDLVRKVGESWRADTKLISGALVDTAELDLRADDDLSLAPLEGSETPAESPLVSPVSASTLSDSELDLSPHIEPAPSRSPAKRPAGSGTQGGPAVKSMPASEPLPELTPLEPGADLQPLAAPDLVSLDLQSIDPLDTSVLPTGAAGLEASQDSVLSSGLGLSQPAAHASGPHAKKQDEGFTIPTSWIIAIAGIAVAVVLFVIVMMIASSRRSPSSSVSPGSAPATVGYRPAELEAPSPENDARPAETNAAESVLLAPPAAPDVVGTPPAAETASPESSAASAPTPTFEPESPAPAIAPLQESPASPAPPAAPTPAEPQQAASGAADTPARTVEAQLASPLPQGSDQHDIDQLWAAIDTMSLELVVPPHLSQQTLGFRRAVEDKLKAFKVANSAPAVLQVEYRAEPPDRNTARIPYTVAIRLTVPDNSGQKVEIWRDEKSAEGNRVSFEGDMRKDAATLVAKMINSLGRQ